MSEIFHQEDIHPKTQTLSSRQVIEGARQLKENREPNIQERETVAKEKLIRSEKDGKIPEAWEELSGKNKDMNIGGSGGGDQEKTNEEKNAVAKKSKAKEKHKKTSPQNVAEQQ